MMGTTSLSASPSHVYHPTTPLNKHIGKKYGMLTVLGFLDIHDTANGRHKTRNTHCRCDCGKDIIRPWKNVIDPQSRSCGCYRSARLKKINYDAEIGKCYGHLTVTGVGPPVYAPNGTTIITREVSCVCDCGMSYQPEVMDYDHLPIYKKERSISECQTITKVKQEIVKCELVCAVCHRIRGMQRGGHYKSLGLK